MITFLSRRPQPTALPVSQTRKNARNGRKLPQDRRAFFLRRLITRRRRGFERKDNQHVRYGIRQRFLSAEVFHIQVCCRWRTGQLQFIPATAANERELRRRVSRPLAFGRSGRRIFEISVRCQSANPLSGSGFDSELWFYVPLDTKTGHFGDVLPSHSLD